MRRFLLVFAATLLCAPTLFAQRADTAHRRSPVQEYQILLLDSYKKELADWEQTVKSWPEVIRQYREGFKQRIKNSTGYTLDSVTLERAVELGYYNHGGSTITMGPYPMPPKKPVPPRYFPSAGGAISNDCITIEESGGTFEIYKNGELLLEFNYRNTDKKSYETLQYIFDVLNE